MLIQEFLHVPYLFHLEVIAEDNLVQLSLKFLDPDKQKTLTDTCEDCSTLDLTERLRKLTNRLLKEKDLSEDSIFRNKILDKNKKSDSGSQQEINHKVLPQKNLKLRGIYGEFSKKDLSVKTISLALLWKNLGLGFSSFNQNLISTSGNKYDIDANFVDSMITFGRGFNGTFGMGWAMSGNTKIESSNQAYISQDIFGLRYFGLIGYQWRKFESILGYQYHQIKFNEFIHQNYDQQLQNPFFVFGGLIIAGIGFQF